MFKDDAKVSQMGDTSNLRHGSQETSLIDFWHITRVLQRWWWLIGLIIAFTMALTFILLLRLTPIYQASSLLEVKQEERNIVDVSDVENVIVDKEFLSTQIVLLKSESLIEDTIESLNLMQDSFLVPLEDEEWSALPRSSRLRDLVAKVKDNLNVAPVGRTRLISVQFQHSDATKAARIATVSYTHLTLPTKA